MKKLDWKGVGQFVAVLVQAWTVIKKVMVETKTGLEILEWFAKDERKLVTAWLQLLVEQYNKSLHKDSAKDSLEPIKEHVIDFDSVPTIPEGLRIAADSVQISSRVRGKRNFSEIRIRLHLDDSQKGSKLSDGLHLKNGVEGQEVFGAQLLDFYLEHPDLIPEDWKKKGWIFFWGTIYRDANGSLFVRYLLWYGTRWVSSCRWLDRDWLDDGPAAVSASPLV